MKKDSIMNFDDECDDRQETNLEIRKVEALERIANAKERIADALEKIVELAESVK